MAAVHNDEKPKEYSIDKRLFTLVLISNAIIGFFLGNSTTTTSIITPVSPSFERSTVAQQSTTSPATCGHEKIRVLKKIPSFVKEIEKNVEDDAVDPPGTCNNSKERTDSIKEHLYFDISDASIDYLQNKERLVETMTSTLRDMGLQVVSSSYHCYDDSDSVSCAGLFYNGHMSLTATPKEGLLTIDIFSVDAVLELYDRVDIIKEYLTGDGINEMKIRWGHYVRGFFSDNDADSKASHGHLHGSQELVKTVFIPQNYYYKKEVVSVTTPFRRIDIWDILDEGKHPHYYDGLKWDMDMTGDERWKITKYASPERILFIDGDDKSYSQSDVDCHEAHVHPGMFTHPHPRNIAIIGLGDKAVLREVLKHDTVQSVKMIEPDQTLVDVMKKYFPSYSDCSMISGSTECCYDDPRLELIAEDPHMWLKENNSLLFDVIIVEATTSLSTDNAYLTSLYNVLSKENGILVIDVQRNPQPHDPWQKYSTNHEQYNIISLLEHHPATAAVIAYEETQCTMNPFRYRSFLLACRNPHCRNSWLADSSSIDNKIRRRTRHLTKVTKQKPTLLHHYDGSTHQLYQYLSKSWETVYCRREPQPFECTFLERLNGGDFSIHDLGHISTPDTVSVDSTGKKGCLTLRWWKDKSGVMKTGVFATKHINKGDWITPIDTTSSIVMPDRFIQSLEQLRQNITVVKDFWKYIHQNGHHSSAKEEGIDSVIVDVGVNVMFRKVDNQDQSNVYSLRSSLVDSSGDHNYKRPVFSPVFDRRRLFLDMIMVASQDINQGEEILVYKNMYLGSESM